MMSIHQFLYLSKRRMLLHVALVQFLVLSSYRIHAQTCDYDNDYCPYPHEGVCDAGPDGVCPDNTDCLDCDPCQEYNFMGCSACTNAGCVWCPSDALCVSQPLGINYWTPIVEQYSFAKASSCLYESDWLATCDSSSSNSQQQVFSDPLYGAQQWAFQLLNVEPVWQMGVYGEGVLLRVNDPDGVDATHPEFADRFDEAASCEGNYWTNELENTHGTAVASLALGGSDNDFCAVGIAPKASLSACVGPTAISDENAARFFLDGLETTHISINSWGFDACERHADSAELYFDDDMARRRRGRRLQSEDCPFVRDAEDNPCNTCTEANQECQDAVVAYCTAYYEEEYAGCAEFLDLFISCGYNVLSEVGQNAVTRGVNEGRDGKGIIYVFAAGNEHDAFEDVNMEGWLNTRFTIIVGAVGKDGLHASYSTTGAALFVSGPGGDHDSIHNNIVATPGGGCTDGTVGTSFATPSVAGAIALVLSVNQNLGWRDVQGIIAKTSKKVDTDHSSWVTNGAGLHHSNFYGFGLFDTLAAVEAAKTWQNFGPERQIVGQSGSINLPIPDDGTSSVSSSINVSEGDGFSAESVAVYLQLEHPSRGDLEIILTSPSGTASLLHPPLRPENQHLSPEERWKLLSVAFYGENPTGDWTLAIADKSPGNLAECVDLPNFVIYVGSDDDDSLGIVDCGSIGNSESCVDGVAINAEGVGLFQDEEGRTGLEACCVCGGGMPVSQVNQLVSWNLVVYGNGPSGDLVGGEDAPAEDVADTGSISTTSNMPGDGGNDASAEGSSSSNGSNTGGGGSSEATDGTATSNGASSWRAALSPLMTALSLLLLKVLWQ